jgi:hypothetical protein
MRLVLITLLISCFSILKSQDIDELLSEADNTSTVYTTATFKSTRIVSGHSIERMPKGQLDFRISHRFGELNSGSYNFWGLDQASMHLGLEYGINNWLMFGLGRGTYEKAYDGFLKFSILRQCKGVKNMPISLSYFTSMADRTLKYPDLPSVNIWDRMSYVHQLLIGRKFNERFSFEINPTFIHRNMVPTEMDPNDLIAFGAGARFKLTARLSLNAEYYYVLPPLNDYRPEKTYAPLGIGIDLETGGHVFQIHVSNSSAMIEKGFISGENGSNGNWLKGGIHLGFNISRVFTVN